MSVEASTSASNVLASLSSRSSSAASSTEDIQNRFLTLLVAQLENQDPMNPLDNTEITSQLAQMSTVQGIEQLNSKMSSLVENLANTQTMQAASMIGKAVLVPGSGLILSEGAAYGGVTLAGKADHVTVSVLDSSGKVIHTQDMGASDAGDVLFNWDGSTDSGTKAANGAYRFKVTATMGGKAVDATGLQVGTVAALVRSSDSSFKLDLGSLGRFGFEDVHQVF